MRSLQPEVTEGPRAQILECVTTTPGIHLRQVERDTHLPLGQVLYHLDRLERMGLVVSTRDAGFRRFYAANEIGRGEKRYLAALRHEVPRRVLLVLLEEGRATHKGLLDRLGVAGSTLTFHLQRLLASGVLERGAGGASNEYVIVDAQTVRREVIFFRESFQDDEVDAFVRRELERLPPPAGALASAAADEDGRVSVPS